MSQPDNAARRPWPRAPKYLVGEDGSVLGPSGTIRKPHLNPRSHYLQLAVWADGRTQTVKVHVMVAEAWHGPRPDGMEVAHGNGVRTDNRASNLRWDTRSGNHADKLKHGTSSRGEAHGASRLTAEAVREIRAAYEAGHATQPQLAERFGVHQVTISDVVSGRTWPHMPITYAQAPAAARRSTVGERNGRARFTEQQVRAIRAAHAASTATAKELSTQHQVSVSAIRHVLSRRVWRNI